MIGWSGLTSTLGVGALLLHRRRRVLLGPLLVLGLWRQAGLPPVPVPAVVPVLVSMATVVAVLAVAAPAVPRPPVAAGMAAMLLDLSLCQQPRGLPPARAPLVLLVLPIELPINHNERPINQSAPEEASGIH